jgi:hypothetical protein
MKTLIKKYLIALENCDYHQIDELIEKLNVLTTSTKETKNYLLDVICPKQDIAQTSDTYRYIKNHKWL